MATLETKAAAANSTVIAPDTSGWNFFTADQALQNLLAIYLPADLLAHLEPHLTKMGALVAGRLDAAAHLADRHPPILHNRDKFGRDNQWIEYHPAYRELEQAAFGTFAMHAMSHRPVLGWPEPLPALAKHAFTYLFNQAEFGLGCPINVTDSGIHVLRLFADEDVKARFLPHMLTDDVDVLWQGAQFMTEREGGSDVGRTATTARRDADGNWRITGDKWFCSNADAGMALLLARPEGAPEGSRGLGLFALPRILDDGSPNTYRIVRLKDKLGTRSMASGEILLEGAIAYPVGPLENGLKQMLEMVNWSRLSNGVKSSALMRRAVHDASAVMNGRRVFGSLIADKPLARRQMMKLQLAAEQSLSMWMFTAQALDQSEGSGGVPASQAAKAILRIATPVLKFRATRDARRVTGDSMEMRGGIGYVEEWVNPRLVRDAHLGSIWEGAGNVVALDAIGRAVARHACHEPFVAAISDRLAAAGDVPLAHRTALQSALEKAGTLAAQIGATPAEEARCRHATSLLYHAATAALMAWEAHKIHRLRGDARRLIWSKLILDHKLSPRDPFAPQPAGSEDRLATMLFGREPVGMKDVSDACR